MSNLPGRVPDFKLSRQVTKSDGETVWVDLTRETLFDGKRVVIFGLPGAFTPTCSAKHLPSFINHHGKIGVAHGNSQLTEEDIALVFARPESRDKINKMFVS
mgnify:CR=1 FL=1